MSKDKLLSSELKPVFAHFLCDITYFALESKKKLPLSICGAAVFQHGYSVKDRVITRTLTARKTQETGGALQTAAN